MPTDSGDQLALVRQLKSQNVQLAEENQALKSGGGGGTSDGMDGRVSRLEAHVEHVQKDISEIKASLNSIVTTLGNVPTRADMWAWKWQWTAIAVGAVALIVGGIIGGLSWIKPDAPTASTPVVITVPTSVVPQASPNSGAASTD